VLEAKKHSQKALMHGNGQLNLDNTESHDTGRSIVGIGASDLEPPNELIQGDKNFIKCIGNIEEAVKYLFYLLLCANQPKLA
jgi:hypothetical protein